MTQANITSYNLFKHLIIYFILFYSISLVAQPLKSDKLYRSTNDKINNLIHTKLDVSFDYTKKHLNGKAWISLKPHFYATDSLSLDAKGMEIIKVSLIDNQKEIPLKYIYNGTKIDIKLNKTYKNNEEYTVFINYISKPDELKTKGSAAITNDKGLYFINPDSTISHKPIQIWTQGETESSSVWFPTIDSPNQKTTQEIYITVPNKYVTLSNGLLINQTQNNNNTRTDYWKMDKPHAPYLFMMAIGDFKITKDKWKDLDVDYYLEPKYHPYAKAIFGDTPEMIEFFSTKLNLNYPWSKYAQIVVRDYVSGAMENTTATIHGDFVHQTDREILDFNASEDVIAHEIFHHWFGNYVTAESWSNLSINESFANLSETLWQEYKHGKDAGDAKNNEDMLSYLNNKEASFKDLIRFHYHDKEDVFDVVSYQKGGRILNMLRNYVGEDAFYKSLNLFLTQNAYKTGEAHQLRLAFEEVTGKDLNWFFNQWYFRSGHPELDIQYNWDEKTKTQNIIINQVQNTNLFILPMKIDIYNNGNKESYNYTMNAKSDTLKYILNKPADLINVDADKILLANKIDNKTLKEYLFQFKNAPLYLDRLEALNAAIKNSSNPIAQNILTLALKDKFYKIRLNAIEALNLKNSITKNKTTSLLKNIIANDDKTIVKASAINALATLKSPEFLNIYQEAIKSKSYAVQGAALDAISALDFKKALIAAKELEKDSKGSLANTIVALYSKESLVSNFPFVAKTFQESNISEKFNIIQPYVLMLSKVNDVEISKEHIAELAKLAKQYKNYGMDKYISGLLETLIDLKTDFNKKNKTESQKTQEIIDFTNSKINEIKN